MHIYMFHNVWGGGGGGGGGGCVRYFKKSHSYKYTSVIVHSSSCLNIVLTICTLVHSLLC